MGLTKLRVLGILVLGLMTILISCDKKSKFQISIEANRANYDTLFIKELITGRTLAKVPLRQLDKGYAFNINEATLGQLSVGGAGTTYLTIVRPGVHKTVTIDSASIKTKQSTADSLVNYLWKSTNQMFSLHDRVIFAQNNPEQVRSIFDSLIQVRKAQLKRCESKLTADELGLLNYQNEARAYSFLMFYGRIIKQYLPDNDFFSFIDSIDNENVYSKSLPDNLLYKYEIQFLREQDSIENIDAFLNYIEAKTKNKDLQDFLKASYLKSVIEQPSYWRRHVNLFTTNSIKVALKRESINSYSYLINKASNSFYASQKGVKGYDFTAYGLDGAELMLSDFKGKVVVIDTWATWCGPCIDQRPNMLELAKKYKDNQMVAFLLVSIDNSVDRWKKYVNRTNEDQYGIEVNIPDGMNSEFGDNYLIKAIPKYILIDKNGIIVDSNLPEPSIGMEQLIEQVSNQ